MLIFFDTAQDVGTRQRRSLIFSLSCTFQRSSHDARSLPCGETHLGLVISEQEPAPSNLGLATQKSNDQPLA